MKKKAFTLIELLIVVAIIAILAAIAVPNFLEAQVRSKVSRAKSDLRTLSTGLEAYAVDNNGYPLCNAYSLAFKPPSVATEKLTLERLSTPIAYITSRGAFIDPFLCEFRYSGNTWDTETGISATPADREVFRTYRYYCRDEYATSTWSGGYKPRWWMLECCGPDRHSHNLGAALNAMTTGSAAELELSLKTQYDPSNGTTSRGSVWRIGGQPGGRGVAFAQACQINQK